ncbi:MAG: PEP/pyruvate-binding domain-containing protein [Actinomycetota bacterium]|nr:PEP/pyruvate-binding domain-containing protein [Actinomycetota bacterium]
MVGHESYAVMLDRDLLPEHGLGELLGGKGAALARLVRAGFPVPATGVVTTSAYRCFVAGCAVASLVDEIRAGHRVPDERVDEVFLTAPLDDQLARSLVALARRTSSGHPVAVRSSATVEDLAGSSFAGQYRSILDVDPDHPEAVLRAVRLVWASLWHTAPVAYRAALGIDATGAAMAAVVMAMVPARRAGVAFTVDPGGADGAARVEAVAGLGEALVSGAATPDAWVVDRASGRAAGGAVPDEVAEALRLSLEIERVTGRPQDVEWAWDGARLWIVQARPITTLPVAPGPTTGPTAGPAPDGFDSVPDDHELTTAGIGEMVPGVLPPLRWETNALLLEEAFRRLLADLDVDVDVDVDGDPVGAADPTPLVRRVRGRAALDFGQLRSVAEALPGGVADELESQYFGTGPSSAPTASSPDSQPRAGHGLRGVLHDLRVLGARRRAVEDSEVVVAAVERMRAARPELDGRSDRWLLGYRRRLVDLAARGVAAEMAVAAAAAAAYRRLETMVEKHLGAVEAARHAQRVTTGANASIARDPDASAAIFAGPTWRELGRRPVETPVDDAQRRKARVDLEAALTATPGWRTTRILTGQVVDVRIHLVRRAIVDAVELLARRERTKAAVMTLGGETRRVERELGRRLEGRGAIDDGDEVDLLGERELRVVVEHDRAPAHAVLARRRAWLRHCEDAGPLPLRFRGEPDVEAAELPAGDRLDGWAASPGRYTGPARVLTSPDDPFEAGDVLVAAATDASWSPLFVDAGAIVVERGGPLSHAAILARELARPAVLNVTGATRRLDGRTVTVDGDLGTVVIDPIAPDHHDEPAIDAGAHAAVGAAGPVRVAGGASPDGHDGER